MRRGIIAASGLGGDIPRGARAFWPLGDLLDISGNGRDLTNSSPAAAFEPGLIENAAYGINSPFLTAPTDIIAVDELTISGWYAVSELTTTWGRLFDFGNDTTKYLFFSPTTFFVDAFLSIKNGATEVTTRAPFLAPRGDWVHVIATYDGTHLRLYINLNLFGEVTCSVKPSDLGSLAQAWLFRSQFAADARLAGKIDEVGVWPRVLSPKERKQLYLRGTTQTYPLTVRQFSTNSGGGTGTMADNFRQINWSSGGWAPWTKLTGQSNFNPVGTWRWAGNPNPDWEFYADGTFRLGSGFFTWTATDQTTSLPDPEANFSQDIFKGGTIINSVGSTFIPHGDGLRIRTVAGNACRMIGLPVTGPFIYRATLNPGTQASQPAGGWMALALYNSANGRIVTQLFGAETPGTNAYVWVRWNNISGSYSSEQARINLGAQTSLRVEFNWNGTTLSGRRWDGAAWVNAGTEAASAWLGTPTHFCFVGYQGIKNWEFTDIEEIT